jgi:hypothetical protein
MDFIYILIRPLSDFFVIVFSIPNIGIFHFCCLPSDLAKLFSSIPSQKISLDTKSIHHLSKLINVNPFNFHVIPVKQIPYPIIWFVFFLLLSSFDNNILMYNQFVRGFLKQFQCDLLENDWSESRWNVLACLLGTKRFMNEFRIIQAFASTDSDRNVAITYFRSVLKTHRVSLK